MLTLVTRSNIPPHILDLILIHPTWTFSRRFKAVYQRPATSRAKHTSEVLPRFSGLIHSDQELKATDAEAEAHNLGLSSLRRALASGDLVRIQDVYRDLTKGSSMSPVIMGRDYQEISWLLEKHFSSGRPPPMVDINTEMAIQAAVRGHTAGLHACLLLHLRVGDARSASSIYSQFHDYIRHNNDKAKHVTSAQLPEATDAIQEHSSSGPDMADLVLIMVAAYAMKDRFHDAFDHFLATPTNIRVSAAKVKAFCRVHFEHDTSLSEKIRKWAEEFVFLRLVSSGWSFNKYIASLGDDKQRSSLEKLYASVISHLTKVDGRLVVDLPLSLGEPNEQEAARRIVAVPRDSWGSFIEAFFKCHRLDLVETLWNDVVRLGLIPDRRMWNALVNGYGRQRNCDMAKTVWSRMLEAGVEPDANSYGAMISAYFSAKRPNEGYAMFQQFRTIRMQTATGRDFLLSPPMLRLFNILLHGLCLNAMDDLARSILTEMTEQGPKPDIITFNIFLRHYERIGDMKSLSGVLKSLKPAGVKPDVHSFTTVLSALYKAGKPDAHTKTLQIMEAMDVKPNVATYSAIIHFLVCQGGEGNLRKAGDLLRLMEEDADKNSRPNEVTYTGLLAGIHRDTSISPQKAKSYTAELLNQMYKQGKAPNRTTYHFLIKACLENPQPVGVEMALQYYHQMEKRSIKLLNDTWYVILAGLLRRGELAIAGEVLKDMFGSVHEPNSALSTLVVRVQREIALNNVREDRMSS